MSDQDIFDNNETKETKTNSENDTSQNKNVDDIFSDKLKSIVNEDGEQKYKTVEDAIEALKHSQEFIKTLKTEKSEIETKLQSMSGELEKRQSVEDVVNRLMNKTQTSEPKSDPTPVDSLNEEKVIDLVKGVLQENNKTTQQENNLNTVLSNLTEKFGDKAKQVVQTKAKELDMTPDDFKELAKTKPNLVLRLFEGAEVEKTKEPVKSAYTTQTNITPKNEMPKFEGSLLRGKSNGELIDAMKQLKNYTNKRLGVEE